MLDHGSGAADVFAEQHHRPEEVRRFLTGRGVPADGVKNVVPQRRPVLLAPGVATLVERHHEADIAREQVPKSDFLYLHGIPFTEPPRGHAPRSVRTPRRRPTEYCDPTSPT